MVNIKVNIEVKNWELFPKSVEIPITSVNLYEAFGMQLPDIAMVDEKMRARLGKYIFLNKDEFDYQKIRQDFVVMYLSISPKLRPGWSLHYGLFRAALEVAAEESTGTWDPDLKTLNPDDMDERTKANMKILEAKVIGLNLETGAAAVALPKQGFEYGNIPQILSVVMGNYTGMASTSWGVRLEDLDIPDDLANSFTGPTVRNEGIQELLGKHIVVGTIVKPKTGLSEADWAKTAYRSFLGGLDVVKDDENLTSQDYCTFDNRAKLVFDAIKEVKEKTGRELVYVANITAGDMDEMIRRADLVKSLGGNCLMIDILAAGMTSVQTINKKYPEMILHGHRAGHGAQTVFPQIVVDGHKMELRHGISMKVWALIARLGGIDQLHIGAPKGKMEHSSRVVLENYEACTRPLGNLKTVRAISSVGLKATVMWDVAKIMNPVGDEPNLDLIFQAGGGTHSHDLGTFAGAKSLVQARNAIKAGESIFETIPKYFETLLAFRKWDNEIYGEWIKTLTPESRIVVEADLRPYMKENGVANDGPAPVGLKKAAEMWPPLKDDLLKWRPDLIA